jgi:hypothetical protein
LAWHVPIFDAISACGEIKVAGMKARRFDGLWRGGNVAHIMCWTLQQ